jgi:hypothetical protein
VRVPASSWLILPDIRQLLDSNWTRTLRNPFEVFVDVESGVENGKNVNRAEANISLHRSTLFPPLIHLRLQLVIANRSAGL